MRLTRHFGVLLGAALVMGLVVGLTSAVLLAPTAGTPATEARFVASVLTPSATATTPTAMPAGAPATTVPSPALESGASSTATPSSTPTATPSPAPYQGPLTRSVPVLMYHLIGDPTPGDPYPGLYVSVADFTAQMQALHDRGWRTITAGELGAAMASNRPVPARSVVVTFDDGNSDGYTAAFPILQRFGFRATFFMIAAGGGQRLTPSEMATMTAAGMEIGNHTLEHKNVAQLATSGLDQQVAGAEHRIEDELAALGVDVQVRTFSYPSGHFSASAVAYLAGRGYTIAVTTVDGVVRIGSTNPLLSPRLRVSRFTTMAKFLAMLPAQPHQ
jgi:peptidoglycan/xylan/chitin deacetylase (PgdA/CDA1 family)